MANSEHLKIVRSGADAILEWRTENPDTIFDLEDAWLRGVRLNNADLRGANLLRANLNIAELRQARLGGANLAHADLSAAQLDGADLTGANLNGANLTFANLAEATLRDAKIGGTKFSYTHLKDNDFTGALFENAVLADVELSSAIGLETVSHRTASTIGIDTLYRSKGKISDVFLARCNVPDVPVADARSLNDLQSVCICYGGPDEDFARRLEQAIASRGAKTWFYPKHMMPGAKIRRDEHKAINEHDHVIVICSRESLARTGLQNEIEKTLDREDREGNVEILIPIRLDSHVLESDDWVPSKYKDRLDEIRSRGITDFTGADSDTVKFDEGLDRIIRALRKDVT